MHSSRRVLYFSRDFTTHDQRFLSSLARTDYELFYLRLENKNKLKEFKNLQESIKILPALNQDKKFSYPKTFENLRKIKEIIREIKPDLIHAGPIPTCSFLMALSGYSPLVTMSWGSDILFDSEKNIFLKWITKFTLKRSAHFLGDCEAVRKKAIQFGFPKEKTTIFPWGIDLDQFQPGKNLRLREKLGWEESFIFLSLRSWEKIYGVDVLLKAFISASKEIPQLRLILLGDGSQRNLFHQMISQAGISDKVFFGGVIPQTELPKFYHASDLYVSASFSDGSSVSLMEALGSGLPVLVSDIPSNMEWIKEEDNGWLFETGNVEDLKNKIIEIFNNQDKLSSVRIKARSTAMQKADWDINFQKLLSAYQSVINTR
jgi:glycosyltransferase involved in cell wall biosynthesis